MAERLGKTVGELLANITSAELSEWQAFYSLDGYKKAFEEQRMTDDEKTARLEHALFGKEKEKAKENKLRAENGDFD